MPKDLPPITVNPGDEYFIAIGQQEVHSFLMLGVVPAEGEPKLLARVGKFMINVHYCSVDGVLVDEGVTRQRENPTKINYQAYSIDAAQAYKCIQLISTVENEQLKNKRIEQILEARAEPWVDSNGKTHQGSEKYISAYTPISDGKTYTSVVLKTQSIEPLDAGEFEYTIIQHAQYVTPFNTCRTTVLEMAEWVLQFKTAISAFFFIAPRYQTTLRYGAPERETFYILPAPPSAYAEHLSPEQTSVVTQLYQQLENIPTQKLNDPLTRKKFDALKNTYLDIVGQHHLELAALLTKITEHETAQKETLFARRSPCCISQIACKFFDRPVTTKRVFDNIKAELQSKMPCTV